MQIENLSPKQLRRAARIKEQIDQLQRKLSRVFSGEVKTTPRKRRKMSAAGRARIRAAQKARWAKVKAVKK